MLKDLRVITKRPGTGVNSSLPFARVERSGLRLDAKALTANTAIGSNKAREAYAGI